MFRPLRNLEISASIDYVASSAVTDNTASQIILGGPSGRNIYPYATLADAGGNALAITKDYNRAFATQAEANGFFNWQFYPLTELRNHYNTNSSKSNEIRILTGIKYDFTKGLSGGIKFRYEKALSNGEGLATAESYAARNLVNMFSAVSPAGKFMNYVVPAGGTLDQSNNTLSSYSLREQLNYNGNWGRHAFAAIAGMEAREITNENSNIRYNGYNDQLATFGQVDPTNYYTTYPSGFIFPVSNNQAIGSTLDRYRSYFANGAYTFNSRYTASLSGRIDGSNYFGVATNKKNVPLWSTGFKWDIDRENFYKVAWLPVLKARLTYFFI